MRYSYGGSGKASDSKFVIPARALRLGDEPKRKMRRLFVFR